jgi:hypothetical protein
MNVAPEVPACCKAWTTLYYKSEMLICPLTRNRIDSVLWNGANMTQYACMTKATGQYLDFDTRWWMNIWTSRWISTQAVKHDGVCESSYLDVGLSEVH